MPFRLLRKQQQEIKWKRTVSILFCSPHIKFNSFKQYYDMMKSLKHKLNLCVTDTLSPEKCAAKLRKKLEGKKHT